MNVTVSLNAGDKRWSVICLIEKDLQAEIQKQFELSEENADNLLELIADRMSPMLSSCLDKDPSRPIPEQWAVALELAYTLKLSIPAAAVCEGQSMQAFLNEHAQDFVQERPEYVLCNTMYRNAG